MLIWWIWKEGLAEILRSMLRKGHSGVNQVVKPLVEILVEAVMSKETMGNLFRRNRMTDPSQVEKTAGRVVTLAQLIEHPETLDAASNVMSQDILLEIASELSRTFLSDAFLVRSWDINHHSVLRSRVWQHHLWAILHQLQIKGRVLLPHQEGFSHYPIRMQKQLHRWSQVPFLCDSLIPQLILKNLDSL